MSVAKVIHRKGALFAKRAPLLLALGLGLFVQND